VWLVEFLLALLETFSKNESISKTADTAGDVDWTTTGKVETWELEEPSISVPGPVSDGAVDDC